jgi:hypothetical protein
MSDFLDGLKAALDPKFIGGAFGIVLLALTLLFGLVGAGACLNRIIDWGGSWRRQDRKHTP